MNNYKKIKEFLHTQYGVSASNNLVWLILNYKSIRNLSTNQLMDIIIQLSPAIKTIRYTLDGPSEASDLFRLFFEIDYRASKDKKFKDFYDFFIGRTDAYISKFWFVKTGYIGEKYFQRISCNLLKSELTIEILDENGKQQEVFGYVMNSSELKELLLLSRWEDFEKYRDKTELEMPMACGYRDGWGYKFICISQNGRPMIRLNLGFIYSKENQPPQEKLLDWIIRHYSKRKEFRNKHLLW